MKVIIWCTPKTVTLMFKCPSWWFWEHFGYNTCPVPSLHIVSDLNSQAGRTLSWRIISCEQLSMAGAGSTIPQGPLNLWWYRAACQGFIWARISSDGCISSPPLAPSSCQRAMRLNSTAPSTSPMPGWNPPSSGRRTARTCRQTHRWWSTSSRLSQTGS